jgi:hypothetical protein
MHPLHWIYNNREFLQAISGIVIGLLTVILIILNTIYVRANWKTMRLMEADLRFRTKPLPSVVVTMDVNEATGICLWSLKLTATSAPMRVLQLTVSFKQKEHVHREHIRIENMVLRVNENYSANDQFHYGDPPTQWQAELTYADVADLMRYRANFASLEPHLGFEEAIPISKSRTRFFLWTVKKRYREMRSGKTIQEKLDNMYR